MLVRDCMTKKVFTLPIEGLCCAADHELGARATYPGRGS
jgi:hypothetical protein